MVEFSHKIVQPRLSLSASRFRFNFMKAWSWRGPPHTEELRVDMDVYRTDVYNPAFVGDDEGYAYEARPPPYETINEKGCQFPEKPRQRKPKKRKNVSAPEGIDDTVTDTSHENLDKVDDSLVKARAGTGVGGADPCLGGEAPINGNDSPSGSSGSKGSVSGDSGDRTRPNKVDEGGGMTTDKASHGGDKTKQDGSKESGNDGSGCGDAAAVDGGDIGAKNSNPK